MSVSNNCQIENDLIQPTLEMRCSGQINRHICYKLWSEARVTCSCSCSQKERMQRKTSWKRVAHFAVFVCLCHAIITVLCDRFSVWRWWWKWYSCSNNNHSCIPDVYILSILFSIWSGEARRTYSRGECETLSVCPEPFLGRSVSGLSFCCSFSSNFKWLIVSRQSWPSYNLVDCIFSGSFLLLLLLLRFTGVSWLSRRRRLESRKK